MNEFESLMLYGFCLKKDGKVIDPRDVYIVFYNEFTAMYQGYYGA